MCARCSGWSIAPICLKPARSAPAAPPPSRWQAKPSAKPISASDRTTEHRGMFDIYLLEAVINGVLLGGVLALLALGLNLIFGVIDVVWICYAELIMLGMYGMYYLYTQYS